MNIIKAANYIFDTTTNRIVDILNIGLESLKELEGLGNLETQNSVKIKIELLEETLKANVVN